MEKIDADEFLERRQIPAALILFPLDVALEVLERRVAAHALLGAGISVLGAVQLADDHFIARGKLGAKVLPGRRQTLAMSAPWRVKLDEYVLVLRGDV